MTVYTLFDRASGRFIAGGTPPRLEKPARNGKEVGKTFDSIVAVKRYLVVSMLDWKRPIPETWCVVYFTPQGYTEIEIADLKIPERRR